jgi:cytochrome c
VLYTPLSEDSYPIQGSQNAFIDPLRDTASGPVVPRALGSKGCVADRLVLRTIARHAVAAAALLVSLDAAAVDVRAAESLAKHSGCNKCHAVEKKKDGPALRDVAAKYRGDEHAVEKLIKHVTSGEMVKFDDGHKEEHKKVKTQDPDQTKNLIDWILSLEGGTKY